MNTLIICNNSTKIKILSYLDSVPMTNLTFMGKREFIHNYYFDYDKQALYYLMNKYHYKYDIALEYLDNLYYVEDQKYNNYKLDMLVGLKQDLDDNNLLIYNQLFKTYIKNKKIVFVDHLNKFDLRMIEELRSICNVEVYQREESNYRPMVYSFSTIDEEVEFVAYQICKLIDHGIDINKIKLTNVDNDYLDVISRIFKLYNLPLQEKQCLFGMPITKYFLDNYESNLSYTIDLLKDKYDSHLVNQIVNIVNQYNFVDDYMMVKELIIEDLKRCNIKTNYVEQIEIVDYHDYLDDEYIFFLNFNEESIPKKYQDIDFIDDKIKPDYLETSIEKNNQERAIVCNFIRSIKHLTITYKLKTPFVSFYPSSLIKNLNLEVKKGKLDNYISYSKPMGNITTCRLIDDYCKFGIRDLNLSLYYRNYNINYGSYSHKFDGIKNYSNKLVLSYTSMDNYYKCGFRYYLDTVLKLDKSADNLNKYVGSIFHYVLEKGLKEGIDYQVLVQQYLSNHNINLTSKERYFLTKLTKELPNIIEQIKKQDQFIKLPNRLYEEKVFVEFGDSTFMGVIDKVLYDKDLYAIVDYKTGHADINLKLSKYGIGMQLPVYLYLAHKKFGGHIVGFYLNQILNGHIKYDPKISYDDQYQNNFKLYGYSNAKYISEFDETYHDSRLIKCLKVKTDGDFYHYAKVLTDSEIEELIELVEDKIIECIDQINRAKFTINPKNLNGQNISCQYCPYEDICFKTNNDITYLGGEEDA